MPTGILGDAARLVRERPAIVVGAGVAVLVAVRFLNRDTDDSAAAADDGTIADDGYGSGLLGGALGSLGPTYAGAPTNGDLIDAGIVTPPAPTPTPTPTPAPPPPTAPKVAYLWARWPAGTYKRYTVKGCLVESGTLKTGGFTAEVQRSNFKRPDCRAEWTMLLVLNGAHAGALLRAAGIVVETRYR